MKIDLVFVKPYESVCFLVWHRACRSFELAMNFSSVGFCVGGRDHRIRDFIEGRMVAREVFFLGSCSIGCLPVCNRDFLDFKIYRSAFERIVQAREWDSHLARRLCLFKKDRTPLEAYCVLTQRGTVRASLKPWRAA